MSTEPWSPSAFEDKYRADPDPWDFAGSEYEQGRYDAILSALQKDRYKAGYEPGCSVGALTVRLARRCDELWAVDVSPTAVAQAARSCRDATNVHLSVGSVTDPPPEPDPDGTLDLIVFSEIGYYFSVPELDRVIDALSHALRTGGDFVACHWLGTSADHRLHGRVVHDRLHTKLHDPFRPVHYVEAPDFLIDVWRRT